MRRSAFLLYFLCFFIFANAQIFDPIKWSFSTKDISESEKELVFTAKIDNGWHLYGLQLPEGGPIAPELNFTFIKGAKLIGKPTASRSLLFKYEGLFDMDLHWYDDGVLFT